MDQSCINYLNASYFCLPRKLDVLQKTAEEITAQTGNKVFPIAADVRDPESIKSAVDQSIEQAGGLPHIIINNAAGNFISPTERLSANAWKTVVDIVLNGTALVTLDIGKRLIKANQGTVLRSFTQIKPGTKLVLA